MSIVHHQTIPSAVSTRSGIPMRKVITGATGARECQVWEQVLQPGQQIRRHYHDSEETITFLSGEIEVVIDGEHTTFHAALDDAVTVLFPARALHTIRNIGAEPALMFAFFPTAEPTVLYPENKS